MLYEKSGSAALSEELFCNPTAEYRGTPFWAWNGKLEEEILIQQIEIMKKMGMGGFHMHVRTGMDSPYLDGTFMEHIRSCIRKAKKEGMLAWLYDEDRWPSGAAGGKVTAGHPEFAAKNLMITAIPYPEEMWDGGYAPVPGGEPESVPGRGRGGVRQDNGKLLAVYDIVLNPDGTLLSYRRIGPEESAAGKKWYAYLEHGSPDPWFNDAAYVDTLSEAAVARFLEITHEAYLREIGGEFGRTVPAIFTDEPQFNAKNTLDFAREEKDLFLPWTTDLEDTYRMEYGRELLDGVPELIWEQPDGQVSALRYQYHNHVADRFARAFCRQIGNWCSQYGLALTGHVLGEESLESQTAVLGDAMRCYRYFGIPGIDMLCDRHEYTTAKQAQSIVHQTGGRAMLSELYGVTGWDCDFRTYKLQGDWQAALGVTVRVPHLFWMTMKGEAKRDYPASIGYQSPWFDQYAMIEDHFARLNTVLTRGVPVVRIAVLHPIESYWLHWGPAEQTQGVRERLDRKFHELAGILLFHSLDYDYICENDFPHFCRKGGYPLQVGEMAYEAVVVCGCETLRSTTVERLREFQAAGGTLLFVGEAPLYVDAVLSDQARRLYESGQKYPFEEDAILNALEPWRFLDIRRLDGTREDRLLTQLRRDGDALWLFVAAGKNPCSRDVEEYGTLRFFIKGEWEISLYDTMDGRIAPLCAEYEGGNTILERRWHIHDSLLLRLGELQSEDTLSGQLSSEAHNEQQPADHNEQQPEGDRDELQWAAICSDNTSSSSEGSPQLSAPLRERYREEAADLVFGTVPVSLEEPNMFLLDMAEYSLNGGEYLPCEELLRIDNLVRRRLGIPVRRKEVAQPYLLADIPARDELSLRFMIKSEIMVEKPMLALEEPELTEVFLNGEKVKKEEDGWYVDRCIRRLVLPPLLKGDNVLELHVPVGKRTNLENIYLLGDFGVRVRGTEKIITGPVRRLGFGDLVPQGLAFYTGNLIYHFRVYVTGTLGIRIPSYRGALCKVFVDGRDCGNVAFSPYFIEPQGVGSGEHEVAVRLYGTRQNGFGQLHHTQGVWFYQSPNSWRSEGDLWSYEYRFKEAGILKSPEIYGGYVIREDGSGRPRAMEGTLGIADIGICQ